MNEIRHPAYRFASPFSAPVHPAALLLVSMFAFPSVLWADCPVSMPIRGEYERATLVFVADVISMRPASSASGLVVYVQFKVLEQLRGPITDDAELAWMTGSEEFHYTVGQRVLVYARRWHDAWTTACTRTKEVSSADSEVAAVRALRDQPRGRALPGAGESGSIVARARRRRSTARRSIPRGWSTRAWPATRRPASPCWCLTVTRVTLCESAFRWHSRSRRRAPGS